MVINMFTKRKMNLIFIGVLVFFYLLYVLVISPLYTLVCSDVLYMETYLPDVLEIAKELIDLLIWAWIFAFIIASERDEKPSAFRYLAVPIADLARYIIGLLVSSYSSIGDTEALNFFIGDSAVSFAFDMIHFVSCLLICHLLISKQKAYRKKVLFKNSVTLSAFLSSVVVSLIRIGMRIRYDIFYGPPESLTDLMWMIIYYTSDLLYGLIVFLATMWIIKIYNKDKNSRPI